ncbi:MAG: hypothetical protein O7H41_08370 [Planctomycetota bacterium]|nr:hypothetical protein [Planctomycetota bacterium]
MTAERVNTIVAVAACVVAILALALTLFQAHATRCHNRLTVRPNFIFETGLTDDRSGWGLCILNGGLGPGIVKGGSFVAEGREFEDLSIESMQDALALVDSEGSGIMGWFRQDDVILAGERFWISRVKATFQSTKPQIELERELKKIQIKIYYESVYGEKFVASWVGEDPTLKRAGP